MQIKKCVLYESTSASEKAYQQNLLEISTEKKKRLYCKRHKKDNTTYKPIHSYLNNKFITSTPTQPYCFANKSSK